MVLEGPAADWFFTYAEDIKTWEEFENQIRMRFGNPNQDQGIRQAIHERKQHRNESFAAFVTDIERLNKMLSRPLSSRRKFEVIWDNMRPFYHSKLSTIQVQGLEHLTTLNRGIDAVDSHLHQPPAESKQRQIHHVAVEEEEAENEEPEFIDAIQPFSRPSGIRPQGNRNRPNFRPFNPPNEPRQEPVNQAPTSRQQVANAAATCWNCRQTGHNWRVCQETKSIFCYGCGELGRTIRSCSRCAAMQGTSQNSNSGNQ